MKDTRPKQYLYYNQLMEHISYDVGVFYNGRLVYPRQLEIHLPGNHINHCELNCPHCAGKFFLKELGCWEIDGIRLLDNLKGSIPYHIYGGAYTEPLLNPYFMSYMAMTKKHGCHFGIHTNGCLLRNLEGMTGLLTELNRMSTDEEDYLSVSIDAGIASDWGKTKGTKDIDKFYDIIEALRIAADIRKKRGNGHAIRICYLISEHSGNLENFYSIVNIAKSIGVDSVRFSIPFACYNQKFDKVREYKRDTEQVMTGYYEGLLQPLLSRTKYEVPYVFYTGPEFTDIDKFDFKHCVYGYYQIACGADGYVYKCSTTATPSAKQCRLGKITSDLDEFDKMILDNYNKDWDCIKMCFNNNVRCNRMGLEINKKYQSIAEKLI